MYHRERRKLTFVLFSCLLSLTFSKSIEPEKSTTDPANDNFENNIIDFDEDYALKFNKKYGVVPWEANEKFNKEIHRYTLVKDNKTNVSVQNNTELTSLTIEGTTSVNDYSVIPLELISTTEDVLASIIDSTTEDDLTVIPLPTTKKIPPLIEIKQTVTLPSSTQSTDTTTEFELNDELLTESVKSETTTIKREVTISKNFEKDETDSTTDISDFKNVNNSETTTINHGDESTATEGESKKDTTTEIIQTTSNRTINKTRVGEILKTNSSKVIETHLLDSLESQEDVPNFSELDASDQSEVPEDYYDGKDVVPTTAPKTDALSMIFGLAGSMVESVVESVAERVVPKGIFDLFKRMQKQNEAQEAERLRSREENGGLGQFGRGILKSISTGLSGPLSQLMQGVKDIGSLDTDRGFVSSVASGVSSVANVATSVADAFKDRVQAIYPGTVWCGDGHSPTARSSDLGLFFFTDTCCRQHDACKIYIKAGETKYGLTNTGLFTRSHCSCDLKFRDCLRKTNSLVSAQIGLTYFNVLGPQCFRRAHPIVKCVKRTRITGQKCEEYELDYTKPKMWQWFDNETF